jgi:hypothetical protein
MALEVRRELGSHRTRGAELRCRLFMIYGPAGALRGEFFSGEVNFDGLIGMTSRISRRSRSASDGSETLFSHAQARRRPSTAIAVMSSGIYFTDAWPKGRGVVKFSEVAARTGGRAPRIFSGNWRSFLLEAPPRRCIGAARRRVEKPSLFKAHRSEKLSRNSGWGEG